MRSPQILASSAAAQAALAALAASFTYLLIGRMVDPGSLHVGAALVVGSTLGIHAYRRARLRIVAEELRQRYPSK